VDAPGSEGMRRTRGSKIHVPAWVGSEIRVPEWVRKASHVWLESRNKESIERTQGETSAFGHGLRADIEDAKGRKINEIMRKPEPEDAVIHLGANSEGRVILGVSRVAGGFKRSKGKYLIDLKEYTELTTPLALDKIKKFAATEIVYEIEENSPENYPFYVTRDGDVRLKQIGYLFKVTDDLLEIILFLAESQSVDEDVQFIPVRQEVFLEGKRLQREVAFFLRNPSLVFQVKAKRQPNICEVCGFNFALAYGKPYIECHHGNPLSERPENQWDENIRTSIEDIHLLCANWAIITLT
jgi:hypothetical protein